jgi:hypothetical protein
MQCIILYLAYLCSIIFVHGIREYRIADEEGFVGAMYTRYHQAPRRGLSERCVRAIEGSQVGGIRGNLISLAHQVEECGFIGI